MLCDAWINVYSSIEIKLETKKFKQKISFNNTLNRPHYTVDCPGTKIKKRIQKCLSDQIISSITIAFSCCLLVQSLNISECG